ncbi:MAG TPA: SufD family Fe-S cluster assembly protein [Steroidobacteraceae bacterium]|jgi:Fe-S cluster assembly protein SufD|nr:SufD family Fe-S cluster assembly protein [Steroidobacteraceae bacterium]
MSAAAQATVRDQPLERALREFDTAAARLPETVVSLAARRRAAERLGKLGWPSVRDEQWRYANLRALERIATFLPPARTDNGAAGGQAAALPALPAPLPGFQRLIFVDGVRTAAAPPAAATAGAGVVGALAGEPGWAPEQRLGLLGEMFAQDGAVLQIAGEAQVELLFVVSARAARAAVYPRVQLQLAPGANVTLIERHLGTADAPALVCATVTAELARGSQLQHYRLQQYGPDIVFSDSLSARVQQDASYRVRQIVIGADSTRTSADVRLAGRGAAVNWQAIAVGRAGQVHDTTLKVEHAAAGTHTEEVFRGIADERSRLAFSGHVLIQPGAAGAQARQSLRGLIEGAGAEIDLRPRLEIHTDEVSAQHGATTGRLDENLLFYLLSRGLDRATARALLKWAFLGDVLRAIELPSLREQAERSTAGVLQDVLAVGALT